MIKRFSNLILLFLLIMMTAGKVEKNNSPLSYSIPPDSSTLVVKKYSSASFQQFRQDKDFRYHETQPVFSGFWNKVWYKIGEILHVTFNNKLVNIFIVIVFVIVFIALMVLLVGGDFQSLFFGNKTSASIFTSYSEENIENADFEQLIMSEIERGNLNLAMRFVYLKLLQALMQHQLINWQKDKTNREYVFQLAQKKFISDFKNVTNIYEYVWYGKFQISTQDFFTVRDNVNQLIAKLNE